jgi:VWFA-related protein
MHRRSAVLLAIALAVLVAALPLHIRALAQDPPVAPRLTIDVVVVDRDNRAVDALGPADFRVTLDGRVVSVTSALRVLRGPGAAEAAALQGARDGTRSFAAEPVRTVLIIIDQTLVERGDEARIVQAARMLLDRLGLDDRVAIGHVPVAARTPVTFTTDRPSAYAALRAASGQAIPGAAEAVQEVADKAAVDPSRDRGEAERILEHVLPPREAEALASVPFEDLERVRVSLGGLQGYLRGLEPIPGRKTVILFTGGLPSTSRTLGIRSDEVARMAARAHAAVYVIGVPRSRADRREVPDFSVLEAFAVKSGGTFNTLDRDANKTIERFVPDLSACYALSVDVAPGGQAPTRPLKVETTRRGVTLHASSWAAMHDDPADGVVWAPTPSAGASPDAAPPRAPVGNRRAPADETARARSPELDLALSRLTDYVEAYQRAFSIVVAEELYQQNVDNTSTKLRSDLLLIRPANGQSWTSFRDVYEVNGARVRDRDERLRRLFIERPPSDAIAQLQAIKDESTRYNIGPIQRDLNVPLYPLCVVASENRWRFQFTPGRRGESGGQPVWRVEYEEKVRPTIIRNPRTSGDVPMKGWFEADPVSGAIVETHMEAEDREVKGTFSVKYKRDATLGLWLPSEMKEDYTFVVSPPIGARSLPLVGRMGARATYTNFRRFQVTTEEKVKIEKEGGGGRW